MSNSSDNSFSLTILDLAILIFSVFSIVSDICTDLLLVIQYNYQGYKMWAVATFLLIFFPSIIVQFFSLRWHIVDKTASVLHWTLHFCMLGVIHRYLIIITAAFAAYKSKRSSDIQKVYLDQNDISMLHLFESFLESAPQLVLQIYVIAMMHEWKFLTVLSALASLLSLAWALAAYTKAQRRARPKKNLSRCPGLFFLALWRAGMLTARISTLVLGAYCFGNYLFIVLALHWIGMTIWIVYQKTDFCDTYWEERLYNAVVGVIYCFCFFNLQEGQSRWRALIFYTITVFENFTCLTIFLTWFSDKTPKLGIFGFVAVVGGTIIGASSMLVYYRFFHPSGPINLFLWTGNCHVDSPYSSASLRLLKRTRSQAQNKTFEKSTLEPNSKEQLNGCFPLSDSIVIVEESYSDNTDPDIKVLQDWINEEKGLTKFDKVKTISDEVDKENEHKCKAICSSVDPIKLIEPNVDSESDGLKLATYEAVSEVLSAHDYENLAAVNIAREICGLRSWRGYLDIETWLHDDSVVNDRRLDTLTSTASSDRSVSTERKESDKARQDDYMDPMEVDTLHYESEISIEDNPEQYFVKSFPVTYTLGGLDPIFEDPEESSTNSKFPDLKYKNGSASTLVAIIDEIRKNTPDHNFYEQPENVYDGFSPVQLARKTAQANRKKIVFESKILSDLEECEESSISINRDNKNFSTEISYKSHSKETPNAPGNTNLGKDVTHTVQKKKVFTEEIVKGDNSEGKVENYNKENSHIAASKINFWSKMLSAKVEKNIPSSFSKFTTAKDEKDLFLMRGLTPHNFPLDQKENGS